MAEGEGSGGAVQRAAAAATPEASSAHPPILQTRGLCVRAGARLLLRDVNVAFARGAVTCVTGPSGAGKSTLLRCLNRLIDLTPELTRSGRVELDGSCIYAGGIDPDRVRERVGTVFQQPVIFPGSVRENLLFGARRLRGRQRRAIAARCEAVLAEVGLWEEVRDRMDDVAAALSLGQKQRLCLARCLILDPEVVLMDEPTSALDAASAAAIETLILARRGRQSFVLVTHDLSQARRLADHAVCVSLREGAGHATSCLEHSPALEDPKCRSVLPGSAPR